MEKKDLSKSLNHLLERNYDAEAGYKHVAENIKHPELKHMMDHNVQQRYQFGHDLKGIMQDLAVKPEKGTSLEGDAHRAWMSLREAFATNNDEAVLDEAVRGEKSAEEAYTEVLGDTSLMPGHKEILHNHLGKIQKSRHDLEALKNAVSKN